MWILTVLVYPCFRWIHWQLFGRLSDSLDTESDGY